MIEYYQSNNLKIESIANVGLQGESDEKIIQFAFNHNLVILTQDQDFGKLVYWNNSDFFGIVFLRPGHFDPVYHSQTLAGLLKVKDDIKPPFLLVGVNDKNQMKIRLRNHINLQK